VPISEAARADLYTGLRELLGPERTETLMTALPLYELDEVATKGDLELLKAYLKGDLASLRMDLEVMGSRLGTLESRVDRIEVKLDRLIWVLIAGLFGIIAMLGGVIATLLRLGS
jgi:hypothetical protein